MTSYKNKYHKYKGKYLYLKEQYGGVNLTHPTDDNIIETFQNHARIDPLQAIYPAVSRIIAIGDLHGDLNAMLSALKIAKVINDKHKWIGGDTYVVQVGDILDCDRGGVKKCSNGAEEISILDFLFKLNIEAQLDKGRVINILGNHELMNIEGDFRYASLQHTQALGGIMNRKQLFQPGGPFAIKMSENMQPIVVIGSYVFVHGALLPHHLDGLTVQENRQKLQDMIDWVQKYLQGRTTLTELEKSPHLSKIIHPKYGEMYWNRDLSHSHGRDETQCMKAQQVLKKLDLVDGAIVMGHTPHSEITSACQKSLYKIDIGMSEGFENHHKIQVLEILNNKIVNILE